MPGYNVPKVRPLMVKKRVPLPYNVVEAARKRIIAAFNNGVPVHLSMSGGKDSITVAHLIWDLARQGKIDPKLLHVLFVDEEAIYDSVEREAKRWRNRFLEIGATFTWFCIQVKHFNCFNSLRQDESFICWDSTARDRWVRPMPSFAVTDHPLLNSRKDTYQEFLPRITRGTIDITGVRVSESIQRLNAFSPKLDRPDQQFVKPIYDWKDHDIWLYLRDHNIPFPETYLHLYQTGSPRNAMRISQFFSVDTARSLVKMNEYEPDLLERIIRREPNAYLAALYWDTEMFRSSGGRGQSAEKKTGEDHKKAVLQMLKDPDYPDLRVKNTIRKLAVKYGIWFTAKEWKMAHDMLAGGDPKNRILRALYVQLGTSQRGNVK